MTENATSTSSAALDLISEGGVAGIAKILIEPIGDSGQVESQITLTYAPVPGGQALFPVMVKRLHADDGEAMRELLAVFSALQEKGLVSSEEIVRWRRKLLVLVA